MSLWEIVNQEPSACPERQVVAGTGRKSFPTLQRGLCSARQTSLGDAGGGKPACDYVIPAIVLGVRKKRGRELVHRSTRGSFALFAVRRVATQPIVPVTWTRTWARYPSSSPPLARGMCVCVRVCMLTETFEKRGPCSSNRSLSNFYPTSAASPHPCM